MKKFLSGFFYRTARLLLCLAAWPIVAWSNDTAYFGSADTVVPINSKQIRMVRESIRIRYAGNKFDDRWYVDCRFEFRNTSEDAVTVLMGFPDNYINYPNEKTKQWTIRNFKASVNAATVAVEHRVIDHSKESLLLQNEDGAYVWSVEFKPGETIILNNSYDTGATESPPQFNFVYVVETGARWQGTIERAEFEIDLSAIPYSPFFTITPAPKEISAGMYKLRFENFKPDFNVHIKGGHIQQGGESIDQILSMSGSEMWGLADLDELRGYSEPPPPTLTEALWKKITGQSENEPSTPPKHRPYAQSPLFKFLSDRRIDRETASILRNSVFASRGRRFENPKLQSYFARQKWYKADPGYSDKKLSDYDREFVATVKAYEDSFSSTVEK